MSVFSRFPSSATRAAYGRDEAAIRTILGEAGNQGQTGMLAVGAVIQNRLDNGGYGASLHDVIRPSQFNGFDTRTPIDSPRYETAATAWEAAKAGYDPTGGALNFANPNGSTAKWALNLSEENSYKIGDHYFTDNTNGVPFGISGESADSRLPFGDSSGYGVSSEKPYSPSIGFSPWNTDAAAPPIGSGLDKENGFSAQNSPYGYEPPLNMSPWATPDATTAPVGSGLDPNTGFANAPSANTGIDKIWDAEPDASAPGAPTADKILAGEVAAPSKAAPKGTTNAGSKHIPEAIDKAVTTLSKDAAQIAKTLSQNTSALTSAQKLADGSFMGSIKNLFVRGAMIATGLVFLIGGLWLFGGQTVRNEITTVARGASKMRKI